MASATQWTWVWVYSRSWWWTGKPGMLQPIGWQRVRHDWAIELTELIHHPDKKFTELQIYYKHLLFKMHCLWAANLSYFRVNYSNIGRSRWNSGHKVSAASEAESTAAGKPQCDRSSAPHSPAGPTPPLMPSWAWLCRSPIAWWSKSHSSKDLQRWKVLIPEPQFLVQKTHGPWWLKFGFPRRTWDRGSVLHEFLRANFPEKPSGEGARGKDREGHVLEA